MDIVSTTVRRAPAGSRDSERISGPVVYGVSALIFTVSVVLTIVWCASMSAMGGMPMPGGWTMSMAWMRMPGQIWPSAAVSFLGMWIVMMVAMMLPSLLPMLGRYRQAVAIGATRSGRLTLLVGVGYFCAWTLFGIVVYPVGVALAAVEMQLPTLARAVPIAVGVVVLIAGAFQFSAWKTRHLACWREASGTGIGGVPANAGTAWRQGLRLGLHCGYCCGNLMAILLVIGVMDLRAMAIVTAAMSAERLAPNGARVARVIGVIVVAAGSVLIAQATGFG